MTLKADSFLTVQGKNCRMRGSVWGGGGNVHLRVSVHVWVGIVWCVEVCTVGTNYSTPNGFYSFMPLIQPCPILRPCGLGMGLIAELACWPAEVVGSERRGLGVENENVEEGFVTMATEVGRGGGVVGDWAT